MRITVYYTNDCVMEMENIRDSKRFWRKVSKDCKMFTEMDGKPCRVKNVVRRYDV